MAQKNATPTKEQQEALRKAGLSAQLWTIVKVFHNSMIIRHRATGEFKMISIEKGEEIT